ncbi:hypothetical protein JRQ81_019822 [Phrynocephalus forsythii]|uniref:Chemokine interleukin-8-like domain-containing protein n=1 Tax=Phrynocephalus forsythii TaxID=171643 RepID=A0A9Q0XMT3_9SAUR|nr:hypothetical protein JRQ81_019822 [Phrynocephalus forsythii]
MARSNCVNLRQTEINIKRIAGYEKQIRPVQAVIFITKDGVKVCVPHNLPWVQRNMEMLDQKQKMKPKRSTPNLMAGQPAVHQRISNSK